MKYHASGIFLVVIMGLLFSCSSHNWEDSVITNNSEFPVVFKFNNTGKINLNSTGESASFKTEAYQRLEYYSPEKRVYFTYKATDEGYTGEFNTRPSWEVKVNNALSEEATLDADGWMDKMEGILPGDTDDENHSGKIYTNNPIFSVSTKSKFIAMAKFNFIDNIFYVTIQRSP